MEKEELKKMNNELAEMYNKLREISRDSDNRLYLNDDLLNAESNVYNAICDLERVLK